MSYAALVAQIIGSSCYWKELISSSSYTVLLMAVYLNHICSNRVIGVQWNLSNTDRYLWDQVLIQGENLYKVKTQSSILIITRCPYSGGVRARFHCMDARINCLVVIQYTVNTYVVVRIAHPLPEVAN